MSFSSEEGQASVEAAVLLPIMLALALLLIQPGCLLYTRCVMQAAAAEGCRVLATSGGSRADAQAIKAYVERRLDAVPELGIFHQGEWKIELNGSASSAQATVSIRTSASALPLTSTLLGLAGLGDGSGGIELSASVTRATRPSWLEGGYDDWMSEWS